MYLETRHRAVEGPRQPVKCIVGEVAMAGPEVWCLGVRVIGELGQDVEVLQPLAGMVDSPRRDASSPCRCGGRAQRSSRTRQRNETSAGQGRYEGVWMEYTEERILEHPTPKTMRAIPFSQLERLGAGSPTATDWKGCGPKSKLPSNLRRK